MRPAFAWLALPAAGAAACIVRPPPPPVSTWAEAQQAPADIPLGPSVPAVVRVDQSRRFQTLEGFGASIAWHHDKIVPVAPDGMYELLFRDLGIDILRLRNRYQRRSKPGDGNIAQDVEIVRKATAALGRPIKILMSSWSPPAELKANHAEDCSGNADCTLAKESGKFVYEKFADFWRESLVYYESQGIVPEWISLENEPSFIPPFWEGCKFEPSETDRYPGYDKALVAVHGALAKLPRPPKLIGPEVLGIHWGTLQKFVAAMDMSLVYGVAHHIYEKGNDGVWDWKNPGPDSFVDEMRAAAALSGKPLFQTEFHTDEDGGYKGGLGGFETAWLIHHSLVEEGVAAWLYWDLIWTGGGLVAMDPKPPQIRDQYYSVRHYARFTDPGDVRVDARSDTPRVIASAFQSPRGDRLTIVVLNTGDKAADVRVDSGAFVAGSSAVYRTVYRPKESQRWKELGPLATGGTIPLHPRAVATIVLSR
jgi:glucuronoarabinoxylan endo-1,4-beta-xylanase